MIVVVVVGSIVVAGGPFTKRQNRLNDWLHGSCGFTDVFSYQARPCASLRGGGHELAGRLCDCGSQVVVGGDQILPTSYSLILCSVNDNNILNDNNSKF